MFYMKATPEFKISLTTIYGYEQSHKKSNKVTLFVYQSPNYDLTLRCITQWIRKIHRILEIDDCEIFSGICKTSVWTINIKSNGKSFTSQETLS